MNLHIMLLVWGVIIVMVAITSCCKAIALAKSGNCTENSFEPVNHFMRAFKRFLVFSVIGIFAIKFGLPAFGM